MTIQTELASRDPAGLAVLPLRETLFQQAQALHRQGKIASAHQLYREIVHRDPQHADALYLLGFSAFQLRRFAAAVDWIQRAVSLRPGEGEYHAILALALLCTDEIVRAEQHIHEARRVGYQDADSLIHTAYELYGLGRTRAAETSLQLALQLAPDAAEAHHLLGVIHKKANRFEQAVSCYETALRLRPNYPEALNNLGNAYRDANYVAEAVCCYEAVLKLQPDFAAAHNNLGVAYLNQGQVQDAVASLGRAAQLDPSSAEPLNNLGNACRDVGRLDEAHQYYQQALALAPESAEICNNLGTTARMRQGVEEAINYFRQALDHDPTASKAIVNLASALMDRGLFAEAQAHLRRAAELAPSDRLAELRAGTACPLVFPSAESMEASWTDLRQLTERFQACELPDDISNVLHEAAAPPFASQFFSNNLRDFRQAYAGIFSRLAACWPRPLTQRPRRARARVGMLVTAQHEGIFLKSMRGVLERLDRSKFELLVLCAPAGIERLRRDLSGNDLQLVALPSRLDLAAHVIFDMELDLLQYWEIGTDPTNYFLPHLRLAPVQCTSWGIQVTSGVPNVDYYLSSQLVEADDAQSHYSEALVLAQTLLCYRHRASYEGPVRSRTSFGFSDQQTLYACPQQLGKIHPDFDATLGQILRSDQRGLLVLTSDASGNLAGILQRRFRHSLPDVFERICFLPRLDFADYFSLLKAADVLLDPPHFAGVNSTYDGLSLGKPIVTCPSPYHRGRYTLGCYRKMGLEDCLAATPQEYVQIACRLGEDRDWRMAISSAISEQSSSLFEDQAAVQEHERIFGELLERQPR